MSELICGLDNSLITITKKCLSCQQSCRKVMESYIACPHIHPSDNPSSNTIFPFNEADKPGDTVKTPIKEVESPKYDASVWDNGRPKITSPVFSIPKKVELIEI